MSNVQKIAKIVRDYVITSFSAEVSHENDLEAIMRENAPDKVYCQVKLVDGKMRNLPEGWEMVDYEDGIARCEWGKHEKACPGDSKFLIYEDCPRLADFYKVASWDMGDYSLEIKSFIEMKS